MGNNIHTFILICIIILVTQGCSQKWTEAIRSGSIIHRNAKESIDLDIQKKLIILPITINGREYRFLFDTGAPLSISNEIQKDNNFKIVSKGKIVDSDNNRKKVSWVQVDSISVGDVLFSNQTAFVGNFNSNPLINCLEIDGIIGSNLIRLCNWTIDQENELLSLYKATDKKALGESIVIPFRTDKQYNIYVDIHIGKAKVKNILVDYGSNGTVTLSTDVFSTLVDLKIIDEVVIEKGTKQSGIIGQPVELNRQIVCSDSVRLKKHGLQNIMIRTGNTVSIGNSLLSRFEVTIDWNDKNIYLTKIDKAINKFSSVGFSLGYSMEKGVYVQYVLENSDAYNKGVRPNMAVAKIGSLDFENGNDYCDYFNYEFQDEVFLELIISQGKRKEYQIRKYFYSKN